MCGLALAGTALWKILPDCLDNLSSAAAYEDLRDRYTDAPEGPAGEIAVGSKVKVKQGARSYEGKKIASFVYDREYRVDELSGNRAVLDRDGLCTAFRTEDLILSGKPEAPAGKTYTVQKGDSFWKIADRKSVV